MVQLKAKSAAQNTNVRAPHAKWTRSPSSSAKRRMVPACSTTPPASTRSGSNKESTTCHTCFSGTRVQARQTKTRSRIPTNWAAIQTQLRRMRRNRSLNRVMVAPPFVCGIPHRFLLSQVPKSGPGAPGFCADSRRGTPAFCGGSWLHLQGGGFSGSFDVRLVHGSSLCRADGELAGVNGLEQIEVLAMAVDLSIEESGAVIVELAARVPVAPPTWFAVHRIELGVLDEFRAGGDGGFGPQIFPIRAIDRKST